MDSNLKKSLQEIVSVESWYAKFTENNRECEFYMHVRFQEAVFGGDPKHRVRFRLRLRKADVIVIAESPIKIPKSRVRRDRLNIEATYEQERTREAGAKASVSGNVKASVTGVKVDVAASGNADVSVRSKSKSTRKIRHSGTLVEHSVDAEGNNRWSFVPADGNHLFGQVFTDTEPLMILKHDEGMARIPPCVKVRVKCRREDIDVLDLESKEVPKGILKKGIGADKKLLLAEEIIKDALSAEGLEFEDVAEKFAVITVADVIAEEE